MRTNISIIMPILIITSSIISADIITVDNNYPFMGDYQTLQEAHDAAGVDDVSCSKAHEPIPSLL